jgi:FkbM family methyltransferase
MRGLTRRLPTRLKRLAPVVRERDALRERAAALQAEVDRVRAAPPARPGIHGTYVGAGRVLVAPSWGGRLLVPSDDIGLMPELVAHGTYDVPFTAWVQRTIRPGAVVVDVGANVGLFTVLLGYQVWEHGRVIAYEPVPRLLDLLRDNVTMNWLDDRIEIVAKAASAAAGRHAFLAPTRFAMGGSLRPVEATLTADARSGTLERIEVETEPLDVLAGRFERIDLVKIDVEGAEEQVLAGMEQLLSTGAVRHVAFEVAPPLLGDDWAPFLARLRSLERDGWRFATIGSAGDTTPLGISEIEARGRFSQVLMSSVDSRRGEPS